jgi:L-rhamnose mutarotase
MKCILYGLMVWTQCAPVSRQICFVLDLVNDAALIQEYCRVHEPGSVWPGAARQDSARWEAYMATFQRALPGAAAGEKWLPMRRIFALADLKELSRS